MPAQGGVCSLKKFFVQDPGEVSSELLFSNGAVQQNHRLMIRYFDRLMDAKYTWYRHINYINNRDTFFHTFSYKKPRHLNWNYCYRIQTTSFKKLNTCISANP